MDLTRDPSDVVTSAPATVAAWDWEAARAFCVRAARRYVDATAAEDVAHEALTRAWRNRHACRQPDHPWPWLARILHNEAMRYLNRAPDCDVEAEPACAGGCDEVLERLSVRAIVRTLPEGDRVVLRLHYELDLSVTSMARLLDVSEGAVKVRLHRARARLRATLGQP
jgi:RNA polymerase sigma-70 factor, ECF subfamily